MINDWIGARLTGEITVEPTNGSTNGLMDLTTRDWSDALIARAGLDRAMFPRVVEPGTIVGGVTGAAAADTGLAEGTPFVAATGLGQFASLSEAGRAFVQWDRTILPNPANRQVYDEARERWQIAYAAQKALVDQGVTTSMWRAPGT